MIYTPVTLEYLAYLKFLKTPEGQGFPVPRDVTDYAAHRDEWTKQYAPPEEPTEPTEPTEPIEGEWTVAQKSAYERYQGYANLYRDPADYYATTIKAFFDNYDVASEQLDEWETEASRDYQQYRDFASYREPGEVYFTSLDDFVTNWEKSQTQQDIWSGRYTEAETRQGELDEYYERQRQRAEAAAQEAYRPEVQYGPAFYKKQEALGGESVYYQDWMRSMFPELQRRFEATQPRPVGYPTREEARQVAAQKEQLWGQYLIGEAPELRQEFYGQRPYARGERPSIYQPRIRQVSY